MTFHVVYNPEDLAHLKRTMGLLGNDKTYQVALGQIGLALRTKMAVYPPIGPWNKPPYPYYERGRGTWTSADRNLGNSKDMQKKWYHTVYPGWVEVGVKDEVTYARFIHGEEQVWWAPSHGWKKLLTVAKELLPNFIRKLEEQIVRVWNA